MRRSLYRVANRAKREATAKIPPLRAVTELRYRARVDGHRSRLPVLGGHTRELVGRLDRDGAVVTTLHDLALPGTSELQHTLEDCACILAGGEHHAGASAIELDQADLTERAALWQWGLSDPLLDLAENYLGLPMTYHGAYVARQIADGRTVSTRQWHRDIEDRRVLKMLVWLNDVNSSGGPFEYLPVDRSAALAGTLRYVGGYRSDEEIARLVPREQWRRCVGARWTVVLADTARLFHRGCPPTRTDRYSVTFTWTSRRPIAHMRRATYDAEQAGRLVHGLSARQQACLPIAVTRAAPGQ